MPLHGTFDVLDFSEVLRLLARQQLTGRLHVRCRACTANLFLEEGALVGADQSEHQTAAAAGDMRGRLEEICFEMLDAERGAFEFHPGRPSTLPRSTKLQVDAVLARARKRLQEWEDLQEMIPSLDLQPRLVHDLDRSEVTLDQERWRMLTSVDGRRTLRIIARILSLSDFEVCRLTKTLILDGIIELEGRAAVAGGREIPTVPAPDRAEAMSVADPAPGIGAVEAAPAANGSAHPEVEEPAVSDAPTHTSTEAAGDDGSDDGGSDIDGEDNEPAGDDDGEPGGEAHTRRRGRRVVRIRSRLPKGSG